MPTSIPSSCAHRRPLSLPKMITATAALSAVLAAGVLVATEPAAAQQGFGNFFTYQQQRPKRAAKKKAPRAEPTQAADAKSDAKPDAKKQAEKSGPAQPVYVVVSLADQHATIYDHNGYVTRTRVSSGQAGHRTPSGLFTVIGKKRYHRSNIYSGAPMPYMQRITWSGIAMHAGVVPGYPASHGCIRLPAGFAPQLYKMTEMGARVVVSPRDVQPVAFSHPFLPLPKMQPAPEAPAFEAQQASKDSSVELASTSTSGNTGAVNADAEKADSADTDAGKPHLLNPIAYAGALKRRAAADKLAAERAAKNALEAAQVAGAEARQAADALAQAEADLKTAEARLAALDTPATGSAAGLQPASATPADAGHAAAQAEVARIQSALAEARNRETAKSAAAFAAVETWKSAAAAAEAASDLVDQADRRRQQVSVLISRKEGRVFIRQDWKEVWEAPVTIRDPDRPLGTHVYTAVDAAADGSAMRWTAITMPESSGGEARRSRGKDAPEQPATTAETAAGALDRIELPEGARERISELLWTGGSLIVSDQPRSPEMSENATDFIVLTR